MNSWSHSLIRSCIGSSSVTTVTTAAFSTSSRQSTSKLSPLHKTIINRKERALKGLSKAGKAKDSDALTTDEAALVLKVNRSSSFLFPLFWISPHPLGRGSPSAKTARADKCALVEIRWSSGRQSDRSRFSSKASKLNTPFDDLHTGSVSHHTERRLRDQRPNPSFFLDPTQCSAGSSIPPAFLRLQH